MVCAIIINDEHQVLTGQDDFRVVTAALAISSILAQPV
jgi:hypothetical protein